MYTWEKVEKISTPVYEPALGDIVLDVEEDPPEYTSPAPDIVQQSSHHHRKKSRRHKNVFD